MARNYDFTKVEKHNITIEEDIFSGNVKIRYSLTIPFLDRSEGVSMGIVLMNPSEADSNKSDGTVNKLIDFFYDYQLDGCKIKDITICNIIPIFASNTQTVKTQISKLHQDNVLDEIQNLNEAKMETILKNKKLIVLSWGKPEVKTIPNLFYYKEVLRIVNLLSLLHKNNLYVFEIKNAISTFTENGDPRHAGRSVSLAGLKKIGVSELFGL